MPQQDSLVDFIGIGSPKSGTTWIYSCLEEHPALCLSKEKETNYFIRCVSGEREEYEPWYQEQFAHCDQEVLRGEFSVNYLAHPGVCREIRGQAPDAKLLTSLRRPIDQVVSYFLFSRFQHHLSMRLPEAVEQYPEQYLTPIQYAKHLNDWYKLFPKEQLHITLYDDIVEKPEEVMKSIYHFLGVDDSFVAPSTHQKRNITGTQHVYSELVNDALVKSHRTIKRSPILKPVYRLGKKVGLNKVGKRLFDMNELPDVKRKPADKSQVTEAERDEVNALLQGDIAELETLLDRPLPRWR